MTATTKHHLTQIPQLHNHLPTAKQTRNNTPGPQTKPASKPPTPLHITDLQDTRTKWHNPNMTQCPPHRQGTLPTLWGWIRDIESDALDAGVQPPPTPENPDVPTCCHWLSEMADHTATMPQWEAFREAMHQLHQRLLTATVNVREIESQPVTCNTCHNGQLILAGPNLWQCNNCHKEVTVQAVSIRQAARIINKINSDTKVSHVTLSKWAKRNLFVRVTDGDRPLYDLGSIRKVVAYERLEAAK